MNLTLGHLTRVDLIKRVLGIVTWRGLRVFRCIYHSATMTNRFLINESR